MNSLTTKPKRNSRVSTQITGSVITIELKVFDKESANEYFIAENRLGMKSLMFNLSPKAAMILANQLTYHAVNMSIKKQKTRKNLTLK